MAGIYVHIPFCRRRCNYCDFYFTTNQSFIEPYLKALFKEIQSKAPLFKSHTIHTLYLGGGTPSLLSFEQLGNLCETLHQNFQFEPDLEFTLEANPEDCDETFWQKLKQWKVNRLSLGLQSFQNKKLIPLHRCHTAEQSLAIAAKAKEMMGNINFDLIFGVQDESLEDWQKDLDMALSFQPQHISPYSLTLEPKTPFFREVEMEKKRPPNDELQEKMFLRAIQHLKSKGFEHYEVSNFAKPGYRSRHNVNGWNRQPYLGFGPAAHSFYLLDNQQIRQANQKNIRAYIFEPENNLAFKEVLSEKDILNESILLSLRQDCGVDMDVLNKRCKFAGSEPVITQSVIERLYKMGLISRTNKGLSLTEKGFTLADTVAEELFV
jgi:oxygen-independent coproporphyrinogen-3 oxidase